ncbi:hypothetical protein JHK82_039370 [Glycine max]|nr:hypothetical protein JHK82_039370 [Glycine max]KAG5121433.1 hypothetical protein JHK84_039773 [Glycine max]
MTLSGSNYKYLERELILCHLFRVGRAFYGKPLHLWDSSSVVLTNFTTRFTFTIDRATTDNVGDDFAFYIAPHGYHIPPNAADGNFGLFNATSNPFIPHYHVLAIEFDTFNGTIDPPMQHVGIDNNSLKSLITAEFDLDKNLRNECNVLVTYTVSNRTLFVSWSFNGTATPKSKNSSLSYQIDLMDILPEWVDVGFSASTSQYTERNIIHSWEFSSTLNSSSTASKNNSSDNDVAKKHGKGLSMVALVVVATCPTVLVTAAVVARVIIMKKRRGGGDSDHNERGPTFAMFDLDRATIPRRFEYKELVVATKGFAEEAKLGRGGSGQVYKGVLSYLGRVVAFVGWCYEKGEFLLVFEYMPNGSLDTHLFGEKKTLAWDVRYKVAYGVALALRYLHEDAEQSVLHRDIKSANVLLDTDFSTKLGDFGMAKLVDPRLRTQRTGLVGTYGASKESDIYSFGVVALEIACGRRTYQDGEYHVPLVSWVWQLYVEGNVLDVVDERLNKEFDVDEMTSLIVVGLWCTNPNDKERPKAAQVIKVLQLEASLPVLPLDMHDGPPSSLDTHAQSTYNSSQLVPFTNSFVTVGR